VGHRSVRVLVVDDEPGISSLLTETLRLAGFEAAIASTGIEALEALKRSDFDLVLLDVNLPILDGFQTLAQLRQRSPALPIIMISARLDKSDVIEGLKLGADDYITKPFSIEEVVMRINAVMRRTHQIGDQETLTVGPITLSIASYDVWLDEERVDLSRTEFTLLRILMENPNRVLTKDQLLREVWGYDFATSTNVVDTYISYLRKKLHKGGFAGIKTVRGVGFQLKSA
jgi:two-component system OmpR family response regulator